MKDEMNGSEIAIIGIAGRFPGAKNVEEFWKNIKNGVESISFFTDEELLSSGIDSAVVSDSNYVKARGVLEDAEFFDAAFFDLNPREAEITDPQHRLFLESANVALENAGYNSQNYSGSIGVYAGASLSGYLLNVYLNQNIIESVDSHQLTIGGDKDYLTTRVSYKLNLEGPSYTVQTACSTSLVAVHLACQSLLSGECDMALAGGVRINSSRKAGYFYKEGGIGSKDGHCRAFDAKAQGTVSGEGVGIVVLKRLEDALADGDSIHAVIKGSAINNDGSFKVSYTAPRIDSQAKVIRTAQVIAEVEPETITYIEAHGTGTSLGDPIEIAALTQAFRSSTEKKGFCAIGSVKTNIGHLDAAAGVTGLIKTVLALKHKQIPPSLHFEEPNPQIDFANSPFYVSTSLSEWKSNGTPRRAGVSSFGIGGTNAHVILEEAPAVEPSGHSRPWQLLLLSAKTNTALETATANLANYFQQNPNLNLADVAHTLGVGRLAFDHRRMVVCQHLNGAVKALSTLDPQQVFTHYQKPCNRPVVFMFSPQGAQYVNMGRELYQSELTFTEQVDYCAELLKPHLGLDIRHVLYPSAAQTQEATQQLTQTAITQPTLFVIEYALAKLWMEWGVRPEAMIGHSIGEYVAATIAGVFSLEDALALVAKRGRLMQQLPKGAMLSVQLNESEVQLLLGAELSLAGSNAPSTCVVSGPTEAIDELQQKLVKKGVGCRRLHTSHAFHSQMMDPIIDTYTQELQKVKLNPPQIPFVSNVSGTWITTAQACDPNYWARHLRQPVRFSEGITELLKTRERILLEVGPGRTLSTFARQHQITELVVLTSIRHPQEQQSDVAFLLNTLGRLWLFGVKVDWSGFYAHERRYHIPLPTYPFERQRYWIEPGGRPKNVESKNSQKLPIADWFYIPCWKQSIPLKALKGRELAKQKLCWLVFVDAYKVGSQIAKRLEVEGHDVITVILGDQFTKVSERVYAINPQRRDDYDALIQAVQVCNLTPQAIAHFWSITPNNQTNSEIEILETSQHLGFWCLLFLAQALSKQNITDSLPITVVTNNLYDVTGEEHLCPQKATVLGPCKVIGQEYPNISCRNIDIVIPASEMCLEEKLIDQLLAELTASSDAVVAYRGQYRWVQTFEAVQLDAAIKERTPLISGGVYLITGGLGGIGLVLAEYLARTVQAKLVLIGRSSLPEKDQWAQWLATYDDQDAVSNKIRKVQALENLGAEVLIINADVANYGQMQAAIAQALQQFGAINGVIHAAGIAGGGMIQLKAPEIAKSVLAPKVKGTLVLDALLRDVKLDFLVLCSSMNAILGGFGQVDYCAANAFLDAFAHRDRKRGSFTVAVNWDAWQQVGMAVNTALPDALKHKRQESLKTGIVPQEGTEAFSRILQSGLSQVIVSTKDFQTVLQQYSSKSLEKELALLEEKLAEAKFSQSTHPRPNLGNDYVAPRNEVEEAIAEIWQQFLGIEQVGIHDNFFELGGHSLLATQVISRLRKVFQVELPLRCLFESPTIAKLAETIEKTMKAGQGLMAPPIAPVPREKNLPLSFAQQRLWFLNQLAPHDTSYNISTTVRLIGSLNVPALEQSLNEIVRRHEVLRTTFTTVNGQPVQVIAPTLTLAVPVVDFSEILDNKQQNIHTIAKEEAEKPFALDKSPLLRVTLLRLGEADNVVLFTMHHIISDGWSMGVIIREIATLYEAFCLGKSSPLPELPIQYADFAVWQRQWLQGEVLETQLAYWKQQLGNNLPVLKLPTDCPRPAVQTHRGARQSLRLDKTLSEALKKLTTEEGVTLFMTLLAAFVILLHYYSEQDDIVVGTDVANRNQAETEGLIGFFVNQLVLRTYLGGNPNFRELLGRVRDCTLGAYAHQDLPFDKLVEVLNPERQLSHTPLFQVKIILQNTPIQPLELSSLTLSPLEVENTTVTHDLLLELMDTEQGITGLLKYNTDLFEQSSITRMLEHFQTILRNVVTEPNVKLNELKTVLMQVDKQQQIAKEQTYQNTLQQKLSNIKRKSNSK
ncbi:MAG: SDR family NAD(P)-dependent oxidoreductase [Scytonema hyalinum WJT4-NPBG1]|jgi:acyl transferase domain-containing protein|nr:SDR family NAD(P)-dependent oxidoreductase [Scytonema hyalinum WJT4-NPBG1]